MRRTNTPGIVLGIVLILFGIGTGCAHRPPVQNVRVPPLIDLTRHEIIGVIEFQSDSRRELAVRATRRFEEMARQDQGLVRMVALGPRRGAHGEAEWTPASYQAAGDEHGVQTIVTGRLTLSSIKPEGGIAASLRAGHISAQVGATLAVQLIETSSGASLWSRTASMTTTLGHVGAAKGEGYSVGSRDRDEAYASLVDSLVEQVTRDFRATWERR